MTAQDTKQIQTNELDSLSFDQVLGLDISSLSEDEKEKYVYQLTSWNLTEMYEELIDAEVITVEQLEESNRIAAQFLNDDGQYKNIDAAAVYGAYSQNTAFIEKLSSTLQSEKLRLLDKRISTSQQFLSPEQQQQINTLRQNNQLTECVKLLNEHAGFQKLSQE